MAKRRSTAVSKRPSKRSRTYRKTTWKRSNVNRRKDTYYFARRWFDGTIAGNALSIPYLQGKNFNMTLLPNYTEFSALFDRYKITTIKLSYHLKYDPSAQGAGQANFPRLYYIKDYDDAATPSSINELREHSRCQMRILTPNRPVHIVLKPSILSETYRTNITSAVAPKWRQWIDWGNPDVPHYGLKIAIDDLTNTNYKVDVECKMWFSCKDTR